ncbi:alpha/beta hydrolase [Salmonella enterica subsp. enterica serovar Enteritidis]|nr:alpha/beta hydrolase [Salmonella enterica subsp. enterica serovar Enteritidis]
MGNEKDRPGNYSLSEYPVHQLPTTNYQLPTTNYQLPTTNYQLPTTNYQLPTNHLVDGLVAIGS